MFHEIIYQCIEILLLLYTLSNLSPPNKQLSPPPPYHIHLQMFGLLILPEVCSPHRLDSLKLHSSPTPFDFDLPHSGTRHSSRSISTTSVNIKQIITARLHPDITPEIMY